MGPTRASAEGRGWGCAEPDQPVGGGPADVVRPAQVLQAQMRRRTCRAARCTPWRAQVGSAWCRLCQDSPMDAMASGQKLVALPGAVNGRSPIMWHIELIDQVMWCSTAARMRPAQKNAVSAPHQDMVMNPPSRPGADRLRAVVRVRASGAASTPSTTSWYCATSAAVAVADPILVLGPLTRPAVTSL